MIPITKPFLPPLAEYEQYLSDIWKRDWLTNMGPLSSDLEIKLKKYLGVRHLLFVSNGTIALQMAIKALHLKGEIITTPFSFVATTSSIVWGNCRPVFVDINPHSLDIDPGKIEAAITKNTTGILATHVFGNPCDIIAIEKIADSHGLKVIYDAAHAFGVEVRGKSVFESGNISVCSLHATKFYHSVEGGLLITKDPELLRELALMRNFGFNGPESFSALGINAKNSELHAAMGLANLKYMENILVKRRLLTEKYDGLLNKADITIPLWNSNATKNYAYYPVIFKSETVALKCLEKLQRKEIFARRYFYPSLAKVLPYLEPQDMPVTEDIARRILCLPLYHDLSLEEVTLICRIILRSLNY